MEKRYFVANDNDDNGYFPPYVIEFKTSMGTTIKQLVTEETAIKCKELEYLIPENYREFEIEVIKLLMQDTYYREFLKEEKEK